jgi:polysaccharide pyruvyl transferase CsaB
MSLVIAGYYGCGNEGDELLLSSLAHAFASLGPLTALSGAPQATQSRHGLRAVFWKNPVAILSAMRQAQALVFGGGGLIQDLSGPWSPAYYLGLLALAQGMKKKTVLIGQGFGPVRRFWNLAAARRILRNVDLIVTRDAESLAWCQALGVHESRLQLGGDLAWLLPVPRTTPDKTWGLCLRADWLQGRLPVWLDDFRALAKSQGRGLRFIALGNRGDQELLHQLRHDSRFQGCAFYGAEQGKAWERFGGLEWVISMRYHGLLLGAQSGAMVTGFGQDPKLHHLLADLGQPSLAGGAGSRELAAIWEQRVRQTLASGIRLLRQRSQAGCEAALLLLRPFAKT